MNNVILIGRLARDPELKFLPGAGTAVTNFTLAVDKDLTKEKKTEMINQGKSTADFIPITVFGKLAENCANFLAKGRECAIMGRIQTGSYTNKEGEKKYTTDVLANRIEFLGSKNGNSNSTPSNTNNSQASHPAESNESMDTSFFDGMDPMDDDEIPF